MNTPIACTLTPRQYRDRTVDLSALAHEALLGHEPTENGLRLTFARSDEMERRLEDAVAAESECCPFLTLTVERHPGSLVLDITGPKVAQPVIAELFA